MSYLLGHGCTTEAPELCLNILVLASVLQPKFCFLTTWSWLLYCSLTLMLFGKILNPWSWTSSVSLQTTHVIYDNTLRHSSIPFFILWITTFCKVTLPQLYCLGFRWLPHPSRIRKPWSHSGYNTLINDPYSMYGTSHIVPNKTSWTSSISPFLCLIIYWNFFSCFFPSQ